ncbi:MAG: FAD-binding oxidoreductase [Bacteroidales bacterium]|nr:FAD-binding oxidoreductase [Bacteroidales bacterium]
MKVSDVAIQNSKGETLVTDKNGLKINKKLAKLTDTRWLNDSTYVLTLERNGLEFEPGQYVTLGIPQNKQTREYSIYSGSNEDSIEVIIKEVEDGFLSLKLGKVKIGDMLLIDGPFGFFNLNPKEIHSHKHLFIATGTGISPFHSFIKSFDNLDYTILHGVRNGKEAYECEHYDSERYILCTSRDTSGDFSGRVTDYLKQNDVDTNTLVYLCGNSEMVYDAYDILMSKGLPSDNIRTEVYF